MGVPIGGQFFVPTQIRQFANPCQSVSIRANPCQSCANRGPIFWSDTNSPICKSVSIRANPVPIGGQFFGPTQIRQFANPCQSVPILCQSGANFLVRHRFANLPIRVNPCQSVSIHANPCQSCAN